MTLGPINVRVSQTETTSVQVALSQTGIKIAAAVGPQGPTGPQGAGSVKSTIATTGNITLSGEQTIDGVLTSTTRVLVKDQTTETQNGVYISASGAWSRASDFLAWSSISGALISIVEGTTNNATIWLCDVGPTGTVGTDPIIFVNPSGGGGGSGTVTSVSVTAQNGVSGTVTNPTTTPAIALTLGAITPTSVAASGNVTGSNLSGTNTGDQTISLTGEVTGSGTGSFAATITANAVTNAKLAQMPTQTIKGNNTGSTADALDLTATQTTAMLNTFTSSLKGLAPSSGGGSTNFLRADGTWTAPADLPLTLTGDVTGTGTGTVSTTIATSAVTYPKIQNVTATDRLLGRSSALAGVIEEIVCTSAGRALLDDADNTAQRTTLGLGTLATQSGTFSGTSSGTNTGDQTITLTGDVTGSGTGSFAATIANGAVTNAKLAGSIAVNKLVAVTASKALVSDASGFLDVSTATSSEVGYLSGVTSAIQTQLNSKLNLSGGTLTGALILAADPVTALGAATKQYVDSVAEGFATKAPALVSTTANITLSGEQTIDGVLTSSSRVLVQFQSAPAENGIYVSSSGAWSRSTDMNAWTEVPSAYVFIQQGTLYGDTSWLCTSNAGGTLGVTAITWVQFSGAGTYTTDGQGLLFTGTQLSLVLDGSTLSKSGSGLKVANDGITTTQILNSNVTYAKIQNVSATDKLLGRSSSGAGVVEEIACTAAGRALIDDATASDQRTTLGLGTLATQSGTFSGTSSGTNTGDQTITLTGGVTGSGTGSFAATVVTNANLTGPITSVGNATTIANAQLAAIAGLTSAADRLPYFTGSGTASLATFTAAGRAIVDDADATAQRATLGLGTAAVLNATVTAGALFYGSSGAITPATRLAYNASGPFGHLSITAASATAQPLLLAADAAQTNNLLTLTNSVGSPYILFGPPQISGAATTSNTFRITTTLPSTMTAETRCVSLTANSAGSDSFQVSTLFTQLSSGYTGSSGTYCIQANNVAAGTGNTYTGSTAVSYRFGNANHGIRSLAVSSTTGINCAVLGSSYNATGANYGGWFSATQSTTAPTLNVGVACFALGATTSCAGYFGLQQLATVAPTFTNAALICENGTTTSDIFVARDNGTEVFAIMDGGALTVASTITAVGTTGARTINKAAGRVNIAAAGTSVVVTNSLCTANSIVLVTIATNDATATVKSVVPAAGSFTINTAAVTAETAFNFLVLS